MSKAKTPEQKQQQADARERLGDLVEALAYVRPNDWTNSTKELHDDLTPLLDLAVDFNSKWAPVRESQSDSGKASRDQGLGIFAEEEPTLEERVEQLELRLNGHMGIGVGEQA